MNKSFFVTGTNTDIGKTFVCAGVCYQLSKQLKDDTINYIKPIATGVDPINEDIEFLNKSMGSCLNFSSNYLLEFKEPASPYIAALNENQPIDYPHLLNDINHLIEKNNVSVIEGAGGLMVPITTSKLMLDLMLDLKAPVIVVAHFGLGTVNHTLLTIDKLKNSGVPIIGIVLNQPSTSNQAEYSVAVKSNAKEIERVGGVPVLGQLKYDESFESIEFEKIAKSILARL